jgi:hypothetical protein
MYRHTYTPNRCVSLGIDSGKESGWGIFASETFVQSGVAVTNKDREEAVKLAVTVSREKNLPLVVIRETWTPGWNKKKRSFKTVFGLGASWGRWEPVLEEIKFPKARIFTVTQTEWRKKILKLYPGKYLRDQAKKYAVFTCKTLNWFSGLPKDLTHDRAEGTLIAFYAIHDERVADAIKYPNRLRKV